MALVINTNISSLTAQRALAESNSELQTAMERLATGSKINSAADDAAGLAMVQRMTAQVRGLAMAVKNANDGQALTQSVEGALGEVSDMLQRMRELALQSANGTNSSADRSFLQSEVNLLIQEISRVAGNTRYNGELILDGTFLNKSLQVGVEEGENIIFSVESVAAEMIGAHTLVGNGQSAIAPGTTPPVNLTTTNDDIEIFGYLGTVKTAASPTDSAKETAVKINNLTGQSGVKAYAKTYVSLYSATTTAKTYSVNINGYETGNFVIAEGDVESAVDAINQISGSTGVTASSADNKILLFDSDGDDITIENTQTLAGHNDLRVQKIAEDGQITSTVGSAVSLGISGTNDATRVSGTLKLVSPNAFSIDQKAVNEIHTVTPGGLSTYGAGDTLTISDGVTTATVSYTSSNIPGTDIDKLVEGIQSATNYGDLKFEVAKSADGTKLEFTYKAAGRNYQVDTWTPTTSDLTNGDGSANAIVIDNGNSQVANISLAAAAHGNVDALITAIKGHGSYGAQNFTVYKNAAGTGVEFIYKTPGDQTKPSITVAGAQVVVSTSDTKAAGPGRPSYDISGQTDESIALKEAGVNSLGYYTENSAAGSLKNLTQIQISNMVDAGDSISIIDAALDKVAQMRSDLGAIENRLAYTVSNLMNIAEKTADAKSRLDDADYALESARLAKAQVIQQAGTSMLSQANQLTQLVLDLLR